MLQNNKIFEVMKLKRLTECEIKKRTAIHIPTISIIPTDGNKAS